MRRQILSAKLQPLLALKYSPISTTHRFTPPADDAAYTSDRLRYRMCMLFSGPAYDTSFCQAVACVLSHRASAYIPPSIARRCLRQSRLVDCRRCAVGPTRKPGAMASVWPMNLKFCGLAREIRAGVCHSSGNVQLVSLPDPLSGSNSPVGEEVCDFIGA